MYLGIDGGGTKTAFRLMDDSQKIIHAFEKGPTAIRSVPFDTVIHTLAKGIQHMRALAEIKTVVIGLGDVSGPSDEKKIIHALHEHLHANPLPIKVVNDVLIAHAGALEGHHGIVLISGTGSVAYGTDGSQTHRVGGVSYQEGDEGSAYHVGRMAMKHVAKVFDGREAPSALSQTLMSSFKIQSFFDVVHWFEQLYSSRTATAALAKIVVEQASLQDSAALGFIDRAVEALIHLIEPLHQRLHPNPFSIGLVGGLAQEKTVFQPRLIQALQQLDAHYHVFDARRSPAYGACLMAKALKKD